MIDYSYLKTEKNLDSLFILKTGSDLSLNELTSDLGSYNKKFKIERSVEQDTVTNNISSFSFKGVHQASILDAKDYIIYAWKHGNEDMPVSYEECVEQLSRHQLDAFVYYNKQDKMLKWANHFLSKVNLYYYELDGGLYLSNDIYLINKGCEITGAASELFSHLGWLPPEMEVFSGVFSSHPTKVYSYSVKNNLLESDVNFDLTEYFSDSFTVEPSTSDFYKIFKRSIKEKVDGNCFVLTGGCDTRLIFSALDNREDCLFWADNTLKRKDIFFDSCIFKHIVADFNLRGFIIDNSKEKDKAFELFNISEEDWRHIRSFFDDHPKPVSGMFGGELLGGAYLDNVTGSDVLIGNKLSEPILSLVKKYETILEPYFLAKYSPLKQAYFMRLFFKTVMSEFYYPHNVWKTPYKHCRVFTQKPFLNKDILIHLANISPGELHNHKFYKNIYRETVSEWMKYPYQNLGVTRDAEFLKPESFYDFSNYNFVAKEKEPDQKVRRTNILV